MTKYFRIIRKEITAHNYWSHQDNKHIPNLVRVPGVKFAVIANGIYQGKIVRDGDIVVERGSKCSVVSQEKFYGQYSPVPVELIQYASISLPVNE